jgi:hypothetical protein
MKAYRFLIAGAFALLTALLSAQTGSAPSFRFLHENQDAPKDKRILADLKKWTVQPTMAQKKEILDSMLAADLRPRLFLTAARHLSEAVDKEMRRQFNAKIKTLADKDEYKAYALDENGSGDDFFSDEWTEDQAGATYDFRCLDLDADKRIDLIVFSQVYFGPSPGLVFYGWNGTAYAYLFDCSGAIGRIERLGDRLYFRYVVTIIDPSETEILASIAYDFKSKTCALESKLYYAQKTRFPKALRRPEPFKLSAAAVLRVDPKIDNTENKKDANGYYNYETTRTLYGNAVAEMPRSAGGFILAREGAWAYAAFSTKVMPADHSLHHGMEPGTYDEKTSVFTPTAMPCQYFCGWIENKSVVPKKF